MKLINRFIFAGVLLAAALPALAGSKADKVIKTIDKVNSHWQKNHTDPGTAFWHNAAYHTGNMEAWKLTGNKAYYDYSEKWAEHNKWMGACGNDPSKWKYSYGETDDYVLFGDWQVCFQTYADLYTAKPDEAKIARARQVMEYEMSTKNNDYWWWADGLYMVMPVMTKLYKITGNTLYLDKLYEYWTYADNLMYDADSRLYYRDAKYIYPKHKTNSGKRTFGRAATDGCWQRLPRCFRTFPRTMPTVRHISTAIRLWLRLWQNVSRTAATGRAACSMPTLLRDVRQAAPHSLPMRCCGA